MNITFSERGDFSAFHAAREWLDEAGYSYGPMQRDDPIGIMKGDFVIAKWRNLTLSERVALDGQITGSKRNGPVTITLREKTVD